MVPNSISHLSLSCLLSLGFSASFPLPSPFPVHLIVWLVMAQDMVSRVLGALDEHRVALACVAVAPVAAVASYHAIMCLRFPQRPWFSFGAWTAVRRTQQGRM